MVGKLPKGVGKKEYALLVTNYFTKWVEQKAMSQIWDVELKSFLWENDICRFGVPREIHIDNCNQFKCQSVIKFCEDYVI